MKSYVINIKNDKERLETFLSGFPHDTLPTPEVWPAKTGKDVTVPDWWQSSPNRWALVQNFMDIWEASNSDTWIWEDDCIFIENFSEKYNKFITEVPDDAGMLYLGALHSGIPKQITDNVVQISAAWCSHAILYKKETQKFLVNYFSIPNWGCRHFSDQRKAQAIYLGKVKAYSPLVTLCGQREGLSHLSNNIRAERWYDSFEYCDLNNKIKTSPKAK